MIAGEDDHILGLIAVDEVDVLIDGVGGALVPVRAGGRLVGGQHMDAAVQTVQVPGLAVADVLIEHQRLVLGQDAHRVDPRIDAVGQRKIDDTIFSAEGNCGFCQPLCEGIQA